MRWLNNVSRGALGGAAQSAKGLGEAYLTGAFGFRARCRGRAARAPFVAYRAVVKLQVLASGAPPALSVAVRVAV